MSRALFTKLPPFNSVFDEARVASTPTSVLKSVVSTMSFGGNTFSNGLISWATVSSNTGLTLSNSYFTNGSGLLGTPIGTLSLVDTSLYNPQSCVEVSSTTQTRFIVLQDGVFRVSGRAHLTVGSPAGGGSISSPGTTATPAYASVYLMRDDSVTLTEMNRVTIPNSGAIYSGATLVVPWDTVRPFSSGTILNIAYGVFSAAVSAGSSISVAIGGSVSGAECHITREVTLVHAVPQ